jgi:hypothetical protein
MTPKEKAIELVDKIYYCQRYADNEDYIPLEAWKRAKQCALIAVDELLLLITYQPTIDYWNEVKQEIEKL